MQREILPGADVTFSAQFVVTEKLKSENDIYFFLNWLSY